MTLLQGLHARRRSLVTEDQPALRGPHPPQMLIHHLLQQQMQQQQSTTHSLPHPRLDQVQQSMSQPSQPPVHPRFQVQSAVFLPQQQQDHHASHPTIQHWQQQQSIQRALHPQQQQAMHSSQSQSHGGPRPDPNVTQSQPQPPTKSERQMNTLCVHPNQSIHSKRVPKLTRVRKLHLISNPGTRTTPYTSSIP